MREKKNIQYLNLKIKKNIFNILHIYLIQEVICILREKLLCFEVTLGTSLETVLCERLPRYIVYK